MYSCREQSQHKNRYQGIGVGKHMFGTHGTCSLSYKKDQEQRGDTAQLYVVEKQRGREAAGHKNLRQGHWGHPVTQAGKQTGHWGLHPVASYPCARVGKAAHVSSSSSEERSSRKSPYFFTVRRTGASDWSTLISPVASQSGRVLHLLVVVALLG